MLRKLVLSFLSASALACAGEILCANLTTAGADGVCGGALFEQIPARPTGSGVIDPFVRLAINQLIEDGFNTDARPYAAGNDAQTTATFDHSELAASVKEVAGGTLLENGDILPGGAAQLYLQFMLDINQSNSSNPSLLSLDQLVVALSTSPSDNPVITFDGSGNPIIPGLAGNLIYSMDAGADRWAALNYSLNTGSGSGDMFAFIPVTAAQLAACGPGCDVEVYSAFGTQLSYDGLGPVQAGVLQAPAGAYGNTDGYEEWSAVGGAAASGVPEPVSFILAGAGLLGLSRLRRSRRQR